MLIHQLLKSKVTDKKYCQQSLTLCKYHWVLKFKVDVSAPLTLLTIPYCFIGDFFVAVYPQAFCIWSKVPGKNFENTMCCYNGAEPPISSKNYMKAYKPGEYLDADISTDSRFIIVLPKNSQTVQIWFNHLYTLASANEAEENMKFGLASYTLEHDAEVVLCKSKRQNYFEAMAKYIPNVVVTVTADYKVHLWIESFAQSNVEFYKFEVITEFAADRAFPWCSFFDANDKESVHSHQRTDVIISKLMNPYSDRVYYLLKDANDMGVARINYPLTSNDWLCFITVSLLVMD